MKLKMRTDEEKIEEAARDAWDTGLLSYVWMPRSGLKNLNGPRLQEGISAAMSAGWRLHSTAIMQSTIGVNTEVAMITFVRPGSL